MAESAIDTNTQVMSPQVTEQSAAVPAPGRRANQGIANALWGLHFYIYSESTKVNVLCQPSSC